MPLKNRVDFMMHDYMEQCSICPNFFGIRADSGNGSQNCVSNNR